MKVLSTAFFVLFGVPVVTAATCTLPDTYSFSVYRADYCSFDDLLDAFKKYYKTTALVQPDCDDTATTEELETMLIGILGAADRDTAQTAMDGMCATAHVAFLGEAVSLPFRAIAGYGSDFDQLFYNGGTKWNEEVATLYPPFDGDADNNGKESNVLRRDAAKVDTFYDDFGQFGQVDWPVDSIPNFQNCEANAVYCCWTQDRQANDNNGNCKKPYDINCVDKDPGDNTNLCYVDASNSASVIGHPTFDASFMFPLDDGNNDLNAEGPIHCHGLAWAESVDHPSFLYRANNLFYVSMYDHMHQRGYVRNVPGAPLCGCSEQMPIVSRSDCTQIDPVLTYDFVVATGTPTPFISIMDVEIDFNACQGLDRYGDDDNNDLWSYAHKMFLEDKYDADKLNLLTKRLVGDDPDNCGVAMKMANKANGMARGYYADGNMWKQVAGREATEYQSPMGTMMFKTYLLATPNQAIRRVCPGCRYPFRDIYIKYIGTPPDDIFVLDQFKYSTTESSGMTYGTNFELYSSMEDLVANRNEWGCTKYVYKSGFPGNCNPSGGTTTGQQSLFNRFGGQKTDVAYYVETLDTAPFPTADVTSIGTKPYTGMVATIDGKTVMSGYGSIGWSGYSDYFDFYTLPHGSDVSLEAKLESLDARGKRFAMTGLMIRAGLGEKDPMFGLWLYWDSGTSYRLQTFQRKTATSNRWNGDTKTITEFPIWFKVEKRINQYTASYKTSADQAWIVLRSQSLDFDEASIQSGMFVCSYTNWKAAEAVYSDYKNDAYFFPSLSPSASFFPTAPSLSLAPTYLDPDSYDVGTANFASYPGWTSHAVAVDEYTIQASGSDIWATQDSFHFAVFGNNAATTDFAFEARVEMMKYRNWWSKAGIMIRDTQGFSDPGGAKNVFIAVTGRNGVVMQCRTGSGGGTGNIFRGEKWKAAWFRLEKRDNIYTGYTKLNEKDPWIRANSCTLDMGVKDDETGDLRVGLALTSHDKNNLAIATYNNVQLTTFSPPITSSTEDPNLKKDLWLTAHNTRRAALYNEKGVSVVDLKWSTSLAASAQSYAEYLIGLDGCIIRHQPPPTPYGENLAMAENSNPSNNDPDYSLSLWFEGEQDLPWDENGHYTQVAWRGTHYVGCGQMTKEHDFGNFVGYCHIDVCRYITPGNCNADEANWEQKMLADSSECEPACPEEGCL